MRDDIPEAAFRVASKLGVRTIERKPERSYAGNSKRVQIKGRVYPSLVAAAQALGIGRDTVQRMINRGEAYVV